MQFLHCILRRFDKDFKLFLTIRKIQDSYFQEYLSVRALLTEFGNMYQESTSKLKQFQSFIKISCFHERECCLACIFVNAHHLFLSHESLRNPHSPYKMTQAWVRQQINQRYRNTHLLKRIQIKQVEKQPGFHFFRHIQIPTVQAKMSRFFEQKIRSLF